ncbi:MAG: flagellar assembly protein FliW [Bdellovibrionales bacterium]|nr:flagellar assembly protein FliW [Bdellovibrionales bacterium]
MRIQTSRFGAVELTDEDILTFPEGLLGFTELRKFVLLDDPNDEIFAWMQSCENPGIAFPILEPELFATNYLVELSRLDYEVISFQPDHSLRYFTIVTIPEDPTQMTANLKAPIVIDVNTRKARQCVLQDNNLAIREPIFAKLQQRVVQNPSTPIKVQAEDLGLAVRLPGNNSIPEAEA